MSGARGPGDRTPDNRTPADRKRDARRPLELLGLSAVIAVVIGIVVFAATKNPETAALWAGIALVVVLVVVAMLALATNPEPGRRDEDEGPHSH